MMDCTRYEELKFAGLDTDLEPVELARMAQHEQSCARCRQLAAIVAGNGEPTPPEVADELAAAVFERTSGEAALVRLRRDLLTLAEADPGPRFVKSVLAATSGIAATGGIPATHGIATTSGIDRAGVWQRLARRPRLALEGSFVVTMLALTVFGLPSWSAAEHPVREFDGWLRNRTGAARALIENASETAQRGLDSLWNQIDPGDVEPE
jgi:hypothetical protein